MGLFKKKATDSGEIDRLKADIAVMAARLDKSDAEKHELGSAVQGIVTRLETPIAPPPQREPPHPPPAPPKPAITEADLDMLRARLQRLNDRVDEIDARITAIATELANQINELSGEVSTIAVAASQPAWSDDGDDDDDRDAAAQAAAATAVAGAAEAIAIEIRDAQVKLANEQARYQIAFRQDLAELAERLKKA